MTTLVIGGETLSLLPEKAAFLPARRTLLVADAHFGKAVSFRRLGVPVPRGTTSATFDALGALVARTGATRIVFLGDLLHSVRARSAGTLAAFDRWRAAHRSLELVLVRGNHDRHAGDPPATWGIETVAEPLACGGLRLAHHPVAASDGYVLAGHLHPGIAIAGGVRERLRLPCFWLGARVGVLPAFGAFTGLMAVQPQPGDRVFAVADDALVEVPARALERDAAGA